LRSQPIISLGRKHKKRCTEEPRSKFRVRRTRKGRPANERYRLVGGYGGYRHGRKPSAALQVTAAIQVPGLPYMEAALSCAEDKFPISTPVPLGTSRDTFPGWRALRGRMDPTTLNAGHCPGGTRSGGVKASLWNYGTWKSGERRRDQTRERA
jgi:hypothetical protein